MASVYPASLQPVVGEVLQWYDFHTVPEIKLPEISNVQGFLGIVGGIVIAIGVGLFMQAREKEKPSFASPLAKKSPSEMSPYAQASTVDPPLRSFLLRRAS